MMVYLVYWDWKNRPYMVSSDNAQLRLTQKLPENLPWYLKPFITDSSDDLINLMEEGFETPDRNLMQK